MAEVRSAGLKTCLSSCGYSSECRFEDSIECSLARWHGISRLEHARVHLLADFPVLQVWQGFGIDISPAAGIVTQAEPAPFCRLDDEPMSCPSRNERRIRPALLRPHSPPLVDRIKVGRWVRAQFLKWHPRKRSGFGTVCHSTSLIKPTK